MHYLTQNIKQLYSIHFVHTNEVVFGSVYNPKQGLELWCLTPLSTIFQ